MSTMRVHRSSVSEYNHVWFFEWSLLLGEVTFVPPDLLAKFAVPAATRRLVPGMPLMGPGKLTERHCTAELL